MRRWVALTLGAVCTGSLVACATILGLEPPSDDGGTGIDGGDGGTFQTIPCLFLDAQVGDGAIPTTWFPLNTVSKDDAGQGFFAFLDLATLAPPIGNASLDFAGGTFDGTNIYLVASPLGDGGMMLQHSVDASLNSGWSSFDFGALGIPKQNYWGAAFDGRYVYYAARAQNPSEALRYDTQTDASFSTPSAWEAFNVDSVPTYSVLTPDAGGKPPLSYAGVVFDGRFVYFVPYNSGSIARYDTKPPVSDAGVPDGGDAGPLPAFESPTHWVTLDLTSFEARATGFVGGVFDGRFLYLVPSSANVLERFDTTKPFLSASSWAPYETDTIPMATTNKNYAGAVYDGHFIYLVPHTGRVALRFDNVHQSFLTFDMSTVVPFYDAGPGGYNGGAFDGRFVYYIPNYDNGAEIIRYDTLSPFTAPCAWEAIDLSTANAKLGNFFGGIYDGKYLYFVPAGAMLVRYESKSPTSLPTLPDWYGSFF